jgi:hypothetical protein
MNDIIKNGFWIFEPNLVPTLLLLSHCIKYDVSSNDLDAIEYGLTSTSSEQDVWWTYQLTGDKIIDMEFARDEENTDIIFIRLSFDKELSAQIDLCIFMVENFFIQTRNTVI